MKNIRFYILFMLLIIGGNEMMQAQNALKHPSAIAKEDGYSYRSLLKLLDMDSIYIGSKFENGYHEWLGILYSRVGRYKDAKRESEIVGTMFVDPMRFAHNFKDSKAIPLSEVMDSIIENNRVIMMNERHFNPISRAFLISWLEKCYQNRPIICIYLRIYF